MQKSFKFATCNVNSLGVRLQRLHGNPVDVLGLQELKPTDDEFPHAKLVEIGCAAQACAPEINPSWRVFEQPPAIGDLARATGLGYRVTRCHRR